MKPKTKTINVIHLDGGLGDHVAALVADAYILKQYSWITPLIWVPDYLKGFAQNVLPEGTFVKSFSEMRGRYQPNKTTKTTKWDGHTSPMKIHLGDYAFLKLCDELPSIEHKNYLRVQFTNVDLQPIELPQRYVVFTVNFTAEVREFLPKHVNALTKYVLNKGYTPVFLGETKTKTGVAHVIQGQVREEIDFNGAINLIDKTSLLQAAKIMQGSKAVVGVDNGLLHVAGCTDATIVGGFTTVSPEIRMPIRNNILGYNFYPVVPGELSHNCQGCQQNTNFLYGHDYRKCWYKEKKERTLIECVAAMTADKFIVFLEKIL